MTQAVIDNLETIDVEIYNGYGLAAPPRIRDCLLEAVLKQAAIGQSCQRVVCGLVGELLLQAFRLRYVAIVTKKALQTGIMQQIAGYNFGPSPGSVTMPEPHLNPGRFSGSVQQGIEFLSSHRGVIRMDLAQTVFPGKLFRGVANDRLHGRACVLQPSLRRAKG